MKNLKLNALSFFMVRFLNVAFPLITGPYISRVLSKENLGHFDSINTIVQLFLPFATFGIYTYGLRSISKNKKNKNKVNEIFSELFYLSIVSTLITVAIYCVYVELFTDYNLIRYRLYYIIGIQILFQVLTIEWVNEAFENYSFILYKTICTRILMLVLLFSFVREESDIVPYAIIMSTITILNNFLSFLWIKKEVKFVRVRLKKIFSLFYPLLSLLLLANVNMLYTYLDRLFLTKSHSITDVTDYVLAQNIVMMLLGVISGAMSVNVPRLSYYLGEKDYQSYNNLLVKGSRYFIFFIVPISLGLNILGTQAAIIYGSEKFSTAGVATSIFAIRGIIWAIDMILGTQIIFINGYENKMTLYVFIGGILNFIVNGMLYFYEIFNPEYYILTTMLVEISVILLYIRFIINNDLANILEIFKYLIKYVIIACFFIPISYLVDYFYPVKMIVNLSLIISVVTKIISCTIFYFIVLKWFKDATLEELSNIFINILKREKK